MHLSTRGDYAYTGPCPYVPLTKYSWKSYDPNAPANCGTLSWNPVVFSLLAAFQAGTILLAFEVIIQLFFQFKRKSLYFWYVFVISFHKYQQLTMLGPYSHQAVVHCSSRPLGSSSNTSQTLQFMAPS